MRWLRDYLPVAKLEWRNGSHIGGGSRNKDCSAQGSSLGPLNSGKHTAAWVETAQMNPHHNQGTPKRSVALLCLGGGAA